MAQMFDVVGRPDGFVPMLEMGRAFGLGAAAETSDDMVLHAPGWSLFDFDLDAGTATFVETAPEIDLAQAPFCYQAQFRAAHRLIRLPLDVAIRLAEAVPIDRPPVHLFNIGHCGSTLLHHVFNRSGAARCLSEPLFTMKLAMRRDALASDRLQTLMRAGLRLLRLFPGHRPDLRLVVKHFSQATTIMADIDAGEPGGTHLFLYRRATDWANSVNGFYHRIGGAQWLDPTARTFCWNILSAGAPLSALEDLVDMTAPEVALESLSAVAWSRHLEDHRAALARGMTLHNFRYDDLVRDRAAVLAAIFDLCSLPRAAIGPGLAAFDEDSHEGAATRHDKPVPPLTTEDRARVLAVLAHPRLGLTGDERLG